ncbi:MAG: ATP-dependent Clp protease ATP-binding subunit [Oscillospiraceae bacterium]|nr:ATP-dependent Clp protease ATP-binding subunit [Oscillospiraceae bacterium]
MNIYEKICDRCKKRMAVMLIARPEGGTVKHEGLCLVCAKELKIPLLTTVLERMGMSDLTDEDMEFMAEELTELVQNGFGTGQEPNTETKNHDISTPDFIDMIKEGSKLVNKFQTGEENKYRDNQKEREQKTGDKRKQDKRRNIDAFCIDLTKKAREGKLDKITGRDKELERIIQILCRRQKNNPCLIGDPGVGKTAIAEALAVKIAGGTAPARLDKKEIFMLDLTALVAGTQFRGQFESRMKGLIEEIKKSGNIILVIDEVHTIVGAGDAEGSMNAANILKPALSRGDIQVIGATTLSEYRRFIERDAALERRFQPIVVKEPSIEESFCMVAAIKEYYEDFHGIRISDDTVRAAVQLSERYITDRFLPDKAIDLIDEASAYVVVNSKEIERLERIMDSLDEINAEIEYIESGNNMPADEEGKSEIYHKLADLKSNKLNLLKEFDDLSHIRDGINLQTEDLADVIEKWTGIPANSITENEFERLNSLETRLKDRLVGQNEAVETVVCAVKRSRVGISHKRKPVSFIFAGPTGVGKTELVRVLAADLFNSPESLIRLDMSEFMEKHSVSRIIGAPPGYIGYDEAGQLTEKIRRRPYAVILLDEIEKAHPDVMNILLQILDDGKITDAQGRNVNFENTIIIMTTNAGSNSNSGSLGFAESENKASENKTQKALADFLRPEFLNRVDGVVTFNSLNKDNFTAIAKLMLEDLKKALSEKNIGFAYSEEAACIIAEKAFSVKYGARNLRRLIQTEIEDKMANLIIEGRQRANIIFSLGADENNELSIAMAHDKAAVFAAV